MIGSIVRVVVWLTIALCGFTIVAYIKTKREENKNDPKNTEEKNKDENNKEKQENVLEVSDDNPFSAIAQSLKEHMDQPKKVDEVRETKHTPYPPENIISFVFLGMGVVFASLSWIVDQEWHTSYVGLPLFMSILLVCFGLGGIAAMVILACLSPEDGEKVTTLASVLTGAVFLGGLTLFQKCM